MKNVVHQLYHVWDVLGISGLVVQNVQSNLLINYLNRKIYFKNLFFLQRCTWPACSIDCKGLTDPNLHAIECPILSVGKSPTLEIDPKIVLDYYRSDALLALRCLGLQRSRPKQWKQLMEMESHIEDRKNTPFYE